jgi:hypothetical protein
MKEDFEGIERELYEAIVNLASSEETSVENHKDQKLMSLFKAVDLKKHTDFFYKKSKILGSQLERSPLELLIFHAAGLDAESLKAKTDKIYPFPLEYILENLTLDPTKLSNINETLNKTIARLNTVRFGSFEEMHGEKGINTLRNIKTILEKLFLEVNKDKNLKATDTTNSSELSVAQAALAVQAPAEPILPHFNLVEEASGSNETSESSEYFDEESDDDIAEEVEDLKFPAKKFTVNMTEYNHCFCAFDPDYDSTKSVPPMEKTKKNYQKTQEFIERLKQHAEFKVVMSILKDINEYFADCLAIKTNYVIKLDPEINKERVRLHILAIRTLNNMSSFLESIESAIKDMEIVLQQYKQTSLDPTLKLDEVDHLLLSSSAIDLPFQARLGPNTVDINVKTYRANISLFANGDFKSQKTPSPVKEQAVIETLKRFIFNVRQNDFKIGFIADIELKPTIRLGN